MPLPSLTFLAPPISADCLSLPRSTSAVILLRPWASRHTHRNRIAKPQFISLARLDRLRKQRFPPTHPHCSGKLDPGFSYLVFESLHTTIEDLCIPTNYQLDSCRHSHTSDSQHGNCSTLTPPPLREFCLGLDSLRSCWRATIWSSQPESLRCSETSRCSVSLMDDEQPTVCTAGRRSGGLATLDDSLDDRRS